MRNLRIVLLTLALILITGCSSVRGERVETGFAPSVEQAAYDAPAATLTSAVNAPEPIGLGQDDASASFDFQARELYSGSVVEAAELFGQGEVLVTFVQPGCDITVDGSSTIAEVAEAHPEAIFVIVHSGADDEAYKAFAEEAMLFQENMMHLSDTYGTIAKRYSVDAYPTTLLIDSEMRITSVAGVMDQDSHLEAVEAVTRRFAAE